MAYQVDQKTGEITLSGAEKGIFPSPHQGIGDIKCANISTETGEISVNYARVRQDQTPLVSDTLTATNGSTSYFDNGAGVLLNGTWILVTASTVTGISVNNYYYVTKLTSVTLNLAATMNGSIISAGSNGTITFSTLNLGTAVDYAVEQVPSASNSFRYYVLDSTGVVWVSGAGGIPGTAGAITSTTLWTAITPSGTSSGFGSGKGIVVMYGTDTTNPNKIVTSWTIVFANTGTVYYMQNAAGWGGRSSMGFVTQYTSGFSHRAILGVDYTVYFCDGPSIGYFYQKAGQQFDPSSSATYTLQSHAYILNPTDTTTTLTQLPTANSLTIVVGTAQNKLYFFPDAQSSTSSKPNNVLFTPENNCQQLLQANNFVFIFCGSKGNVYLTNGSAVVPVLSVPDYIAGSVSFVQEPYFSWGGAMYLRGRIWFSLQETVSATPNVGGVWSFIPSFSAFPQQDTGLSLRLENQSAAATTAGSAQYTGMATVLFAGQETGAQLAQGPQYVAVWAQNVPSGSFSIDYSGTTPYTGGQTVVEYDAIPVGKFLAKWTGKQIEAKFAAAFKSDETIAFNYRTDLSASFVTAGTVRYEADRLSAIIEGVSFQKSQLLQIQMVLTSTASSPSFCRVKEVYIR